MSFFDRGQVKIFFDRRANLKTVCLKIFETEVIDVKK